MSGVLVIPRYLSVLQQDGDVLVGLMPPRAVTIDDAPDYLPDLLAYLSVPRGREEAVAETARRGALAVEQAETLLDELLEAGVLATSDLDADGRYARHELYYSLLGVDGAEPQRVLANATVGLVGTGGIGTNLATTLVAAGVGTIVFSDGDNVELSNLTRQTLFDESTVGRPKVEVAAERLQALNADVVVRPVRSTFYGVELLNEHFADCNVVILSADSPPEVHEWISDAALRHGFVYSNAGYIETFGVVGPLVVPGRSACYACMRASADLQTAAGSALQNLNSRHQAASYGPLNALVASMQANEVIRWLLGESVQTAGQRLLVDSTSYELHREDFIRDPDCPACGHLGEGEGTGGGTSLADVYADEREEASQNALVLDRVVRELVPGGAGRRVLDVGCGSGHESVRLALVGAEVVGIDAMPEMVALAAGRAAETGVGERTRFSDAPLSELEGPFDDVLCLNVLDHLEEPAPMLAQLARLVAPSGRVIVSLPHPVKDRGGWRKERIDGRWHYREFVLDGYFEEGPVEKSRENAAGDTVIASITTFHRTTATWVRLLLDAGFVIRDLLEPAPDPERAPDLPILAEKSSRVPYFQLFVLEHEG